MMKTIGVVTPNEVKPSGPGVGSPNDENMLRLTESGSAASTILSVPCWWSWKTEMLTAAGLARSGSTG